MEEKVIATGLVTLLVGFALGNVTADRGPDLRQIDTLISEKMDASGAALDGVAADLGDRLAQLEAQITAAADTSALDDLGARLDTLANDLKSTMSDGQTAMADRMSAMGERLSAAAQSAAATMGGSGDTAATDPEAAEAEPANAPEAESAATAPAEPTTAPEGGLKAGQTALLADGAVRAFISRVDDTGARVQLNGELVTLATGNTATTGDCTVTLDAVGGGAAALSATCDAADAATPETDADAAPVDGTGIGQTALLGDGAARVFVSGVSDDGSAARIAVNGLALSTVAVGDSVDVGEDGCTITVDAIGGGTVALGYGCDS